MNQPRSRSNGSSKGVVFLDGRVNEKFNVWHIAPPSRQPNASLQHAIRHVATDTINDQAEEIVNALRNKGITSAIEKVSVRLRQSALEEFSRLLLANESIFQFATGQAIQESLGDRDLADADAEEVRNIAQDTTGLVQGVLRALQSVRHDVLRETVRSVAASRSLDCPEDTEDRVVDALHARTVSVRSGHIEAVIERTIRDISRDAQHLAWIDSYLGREEVDAARVTPAVKSRMVRVLRTMGVQFDNAQVDAGEFDEYFAIALREALGASSSTSTGAGGRFNLRSSAGGDDPNFPGAGGSASSSGMLPDNWDFSVDLFESAEDQGIDRNAIRAAGVLDYVLSLGEGARIFDLVSQLVIDHESGLLGTSSDQDLDPDAGTVVAEALEREFELLRTALSAEERGMYYRRVLGRGNVELTGDASANTAFPTLLDELHTQCYNFRNLEVTATLDGGTPRISKTPVYEAIRALQHNLTQYGAGMERRVRHLYERLLRCRAILRSDEVADYAGGGRPRTEQRTVARLCKSRLRADVPVDTIYTLASSGNLIFRLIADFDEGTFTEEQFRDLLRHSEKHYIASKAIGESLDFGGDSKDREKDDGVVDGGDEFADFDE